MPRIARPRDLREALGVAFVHRGRTRWRAGTSHLLGLEYPGVETDGFVVDVGDIVDFREVRADRNSVRIGAFADPEALREPAIGRALGRTAFAADVARFRLAALGARLIVAGIGATRTAAFADVLGSDATRPLAPSEIPLAVELRADSPRVYFGDRRIRRRDGKASFELRVYAALQLAGHHRIGSANVVYAVDDAEPLPMPAVAATLRGAIIGKTTFADASRHAADFFRGDDVRANTLRRTIIPLVLSALKEAHADARATRVQRD
jgi:CO/xanthine dehydrogenase FAD-binding subunit